MVFISKVLEDVIVELDFTYPWFKGQGYSIALLPPKRKNKVYTSSPELQNHRSEVVLSPMGGGSVLKQRQMERS